MNTGPRVKPRPATKKPSQAGTSAVSNAGFTDSDVAVQLKDAKTLRKAEKSKEMVVVIEDEDEDDPEDDSNTPKRKSPRPSSSIPLKKSRATATLPPFAVDDWSTIFIPTLLDMAGCYEGEDGGWEIEKDREAFCLFLQDAVDLVWDRVRYRVIPSESIFILVSLHLFNAQLAHIFGPGKASHYRLALSLFQSCTPHGRNIHPNHQNARQQGNIRECGRAQGRRWVLANV